MRATENSRPADETHAKASRTDDGHQGRMERIQRGTQGFLAPHSHEPRQIICVLDGLGGPFLGERDRQFEKLWPGATIEALEAALGSVSGARSECRRWALDRNRVICTNCLGVRKSGDGLGARPILRTGASVNKGSECAENGSPGCDAFPNLCSLYRSIRNGDIPASVTAAPERGAHAGLTWQSTRGPNESSV
jgi:hypothetical protein